MFWDQHNLEISGVLVLSEEESVFDHQSGQTKTKLLVYAALAQNEAPCQHVDYHTCMVL